MFIWLRGAPSSRSVASSQHGVGLSCCSGAQGGLAASGRREAVSAVRETGACAEPIGWVWLAGAEVLAQNTGTGSPQLPVASCLHMGFLLSGPAAEKGYLFLHRECAGPDSLVTSGCSLAKRSLEAEMSLEVEKDQLASQEIQGAQDSLGR